MPFNDFYISFFSSCYSLGYPFSIFLFIEATSVRVCHFSCTACGIFHTVFPLYSLEDLKHLRILSLIRSLLHVMTLCSFNFKILVYQVIMKPLCLAVCMGPFSSWDMARVSAPLGAPGFVKWPHIPQLLHNHLEQSSDLMSPRRWLTTVQQIWPYVCWLTTDTGSPKVNTLKYVVGSLDQISGSWVLHHKCHLLVLRIFYFFEHVTDKL